MRYDRNSRPVAKPDSVSIKVSIASVTTAARRRGWRQFMSALCAQALVPWVVDRRSARRPDIRRPTAGALNDGSSPGGSRIPLAQPPRNRCLAMSFAPGDGVGRSRLSFEHGYRAGGLGHGRHQHDRGAPLPAIRSSW